MSQPMSKDKWIITFLLALKGLPGVGSKTLSKLLAEKKEQILAAKRLDADFALSLEDKKIATALEKSDKTWEELVNDAREIIYLAEGKRISILFPYMDAYPKRLLRNSNYPPILYVRGKVEALNREKAVAIVGSRNPTEFGAKMGTRLAELLAKDGYTIVSGLALGSDTVGHEGALKAGGVTVAVISTPIDAPAYPKQNRELAERIVSGGGALVCEYAPGIELSDRQLISNLVARDEWQPGLSDGIIAIETSIDGGTRHALRHAKETGTPIAVFDYSSRKAVDFEGDPRFGGNVEYLRSGQASPIFGPETIEAFKKRMDAYRAGGEELISEDDSDPQMRLSFT